MTPPPRAALAAIYLIFLLSGIAGLGYQMAFVRMFAVGLGHEMPAVLAVVGAFFGGLALGAWTLDKPIARSSRPGHWYLGLEVVIGLWGIACVWLVAPANELALRLMGEQPGPGWQWAVSLGAPLLVLLPATMAMGATLPAMERFAAPLSRSAQCVGGLYAVNTLGAVAGTLAGAFYLVPMLGYRTSVMTLAATDLLCALAMLPLVRRERAEPGRRIALAGSEPSARPADAPPRRRVLTILFFTGLLGIGYEIVGLRVLAQVIENTVYSYAAALSIFLLGTAMGAAAYQRWMNRAAPPFDRTLGYLLCGLAGTCLLGAMALSRSREIYQAARLSLGDTTAAVMLSEMAIAAAVFLLPTLLMGAAFSHLTEAAKRDDGGVGRAVAINTAGGFAAPLLIGVLLMPAVGTKWALAAVALGYLALLSDYAAVGRWALIAPLLLLLAVPANLRLVRTFDGQRVVAYEEGVMVSVAVIENTAGHRFLRVNNRFQMGGTSPEARRGQLRLGHVPLLLHPAPERALFLGMGTGISALAATDQPGLTADAVELVPQVVAAMPAFALDEGRHALNQPELRVITVDARRFIRTTDRTYDVIVADLFHPARDGGGMLYTREHFEAIRRRLDPGGMVCQWLPAFQLDLPTLRLIVRTFLDVFPDARLVMHDVNLNYPAIGLIACPGGWPRYDRHWWARRVDDPTLRDRLAAIGLTGAPTLFGLHLAEPTLLRRFVDDGPINTDDQPHVVYRAPRFAVQRRPTSYGRLLAMIDFADANTPGAAASPWRIIDPPLAEELRRWIAQRNRAIRQAVERGGR